ncbi:hypothetical protein RCL1_006622 [Eukaryota sp. TZLM3-RCL]
MDWETSKENFVPSRIGRNPTLQSDSELVLQFEKEVTDPTIEDPLDSWIRYINFVNSTATDNKQFIKLLERVTESLQDIKVYQNDRRFIVLWVQYADYCPDAKDVFKYMYNKGIGLDLSLFWEAYSLICENRREYSLVHSLYQEGIKRCAHPLQRLTKKYAEFQVRVPNLPANEPVSSLSLVKDSSMMRSSQKTTKLSGENFEIFEDNVDEENEPKSSFPRPNWSKLGTLEERSKENIKLKSKWTAAGTLPQKQIPKIAQNFQIYQDATENSAPKPNKTDQKSDEVMSFDLSLLYTSGGEEFCFEELRAKLPKYQPITPLVEPVVYTNLQTSLADLDLDFEALSPSPIKTESKPIINDLTSPLFFEPLSISKPKEKKQKAPSPTLNTKAVLSELYQMMSSPILTVKQKSKPKSSLFNLSELDDVPASRDDNNLEFQIFEEPTVNVSKKPAAKPALRSVDPVLRTVERVVPALREPVKTLEQLDFIDKENENDGFLKTSTVALQERHIVKANEPVVINVTSKPSVAELSSFVEKHLSTRPDFVTISKEMPHLSAGQAITVGHRTIEITSLLGSGVFADVFEVSVRVDEENSCVPAVEWEDGSTVAMKVGRTLSPIEYYCLVHLCENLPPNIAQKVIAPLLFIQFTKSSGFLFSELLTMGTLQTLVNKVRANSEVLDETLILFFASEMLFVTQQIQAQGIIHCDIKPDNWLLALDSDVLGGPVWNRQRSDGWEAYGLVLVDFGSAIPLNYYKSKLNCERVSCRGSVCASSFIHPKISRDEPWSFEVDWFALAGCLHVLLFGEYMQIIEDGGKIRIRNAFKRYWQKQLWTEVFDNLMNNNQDGLAIALQLIDTELASRSKKICALSDRLVDKFIYQ